MRTLIQLLFFMLFSLLTAQGTNTPLAIPDSSFPTQEIPSELELLEIDGSSRFTLENPHAGDTLSYIISIEWINPKVPLTVLAPESLLFSGFQKKGVRTEHRKVSNIKDGKPTLSNQSHFIYKLKAITPGTGKASSAKLPYYTALSQDKEYLLISPHLIDILPAKVPLVKRWYLQTIFWILIAFLLVVLVKLFTSYLKSSKSKNKVQKIDFTTEIKTMKSRLTSAEPKALLLQMEQLCIRFLQQECATKNEQHFDTLLKSYEATISPEKNKSWLLLQKDFELAKFGGGQKAQHELLETYKNLKTCLNIKEDDENE